MDDLNLQAILDNVINVAQEAGILIKEASQRDKKVQLKEGVTSDLVTQTDQDVEKLIQTKLSELYPSFKFFGEEQAAALKVKDSEFNTVLTNTPTFVVDPIDGTTNFVHGVPYVAVCIGLSVNKDPVLGVVHNPFTDATYTGVKNNGAFLNGKPIRSSVVDIPSQALISFGFPAERTNTPLMKFVLRQCERLLCVANVHDIRRGGSCALDICAVAAGTLDGHCEYKIHVWDVCAAAVIVTEAGGVMRDPFGGKFDMTNCRVLAVANGVSLNITEFGLYASNFGVIKST